MIWLNHVMYGKVYLSVAQAALRLIQKLTFNDQFGPLRATVHSVSLFSKKTRKYKNVTLVC